MYLHYIYHHYNFYLLFCCCWCDRLHGIDPYTYLSLSHLYIPSTWTCKPNCIIERAYYIIIVYYITIIIIITEDITCKRTNYYILSKHNKFERFENFTDLLIKSLKTQFFLIIMIIILIFVVNLVREVIGLRTDGLMDTLVSFSTSVPISLEVIPQLEDVVLELTTEPSFVAALPLAMDDLESYSLCRS